MCFLNIYHIILNYFYFLKKVNVGLRWSKKKEKRKEKERKEMKERKLVGMVSWREIRVGWCLILLSKFVYKKEARAVFKVIYLFLRGVAVNWRMEWGGLIKVYNLFDNDVQDLGDHYCLAAESFVCILSQKFQPLNSLRLASKGRLKVQFNYSRSCSLNSLV